MTDKRDDDDRLDAWFAVARATPPEPSEALLARVMAAAGAHPPRVPMADGIWTRLLDAVGGWGGLSGLATAVCTGIWIGFVGAIDLQTLTYGLIGDGGAVVELMPGTSDFSLFDAMEE